MQIRLNLLNIFVVIVLSIGSTSVFAQKGSFLSIEEFHELAFPGQPIEWQTLWVNQEMRADIEAIIDRKLSSLRLRYWGDGERTAWILEEIGKELPITVGVIVNAGKIEQVQIMEYRESRGGEIRYPFFTSQFINAQLFSEKGNWRLNQNIDGITGATLSVRALKKITAMALYCHQQTEFSQLASE